MAGNHVLLPIIRLFVVVAVRSGQSEDCWRGSKEGDEAGSQRYRYAGPTGHPIENEQDELTMQAGRIEEEGGRAEMADEQ